jgi:hypothetical protein
MGGAPLVIPLVALVIPISLLLFAIVFDVAFLAWAAYRTWHDRLYPRLLLLRERTLTSALVLSRQYGRRLAHHR